MKKIKKTINLPDDLMKEIEEYRAKQRPIPSWNQAAVDLMRQAIRAGKEDDKT